MSKAIKIILLFQCLYLSITALWPFIDMKSYMDATGPKTDTWMVNTMSGLLLAIALTLLIALCTNRISSGIIYLTITHALVLACADLYYVGCGVIFTIYLYDAIIHLLFVISWLFILFRCVSYPAAS
jgi:hypothetical protein